MANPNAPFGARIIGHLYNSSYVARPRAYAVDTGDSTTIGIGDLVVSTGTGVVIPTTGETLPTVALATNTGNILGIVIGFNVDPAYLNQIYRSPSTLRTVYVVDDPDVIYEIQASGTAFLVTMLGGNAPLAIGAPSTITGVSTTTVNLSGFNGATTDQVRILSMVQEPNNIVGTYTRLVCYTNQHEHKSTTGVA